MGGGRRGTVGVPASAFGVFWAGLQPVLGLGVRLALPVEEKVEWGERATVCGYDACNLISIITFN